MRVINQKPVHVWLHFVLQFPTISIIIFHFSLIFLILFLLPRWGLNHYTGSLAGTPVYPSLAHTGSAWHHLCGGVWHILKYTKKK